MDVRCFSCGIIFDDKVQDGFCPHNKVQMGFHGWEGKHGEMRPPEPPKPQVKPNAKP
jgi:hypothetical protein